MNSSLTTTANPEAFAKRWRLCGRRAMEKTASAQAIVLSLVPEDERGSNGGMTCFGWSETRLKKARQHNRSRVTLDSAQTPDRR